MQARRKHQIAHESYKIEGVMHAVVYVDGALEKKCARDSSHKRFFEGGLERTKSEPNEQRSDKSKQKLWKMFLWGSFGGEKSENFDATCLTSILKTVLATEGGKHIFAKKLKENELQWRCKQKCILKLTFLMQIRTKVLGG